MKGLAYLSDTNMIVSEAGQCGNVVDMSNQMPFMSHSVAAEFWALQKGLQQPGALL